MRRLVDLASSRTVQLVAAKDVLGNLEDRDNEARPLGSPDACDALLTGETQMGVAERLIGAGEATAEVTSAIEILFDYHLNHHSCGTRMGRG